MIDTPSSAATLERAYRLANEAVFTVALQHRRLRSPEPADNTFVMRWWADLQFLIVALRRIRRAAELAASLPASQAIAAAIIDFDRTLTDLATMRNVGEHVDNYAVDSPQRHNKTIDRRQLEVGSWDGTTFTWLHRTLNIDDALHASERLFSAVRRFKLPSPSQDP